MSKVCKNPQALARRLYGRSGACAASERKPTFNNRIWYQGAIALRDQPLYLAQAIGLAPTHAILEGDRV
ncbi:hypothetical protein NG791_11980 [Laspinema sp. D1]|nr:hypothetical protein [Laspinema sp. D2b]